MTTRSARTYQLAWAMFTRRCTLDGGDLTTAKQAWLDDGVREFWLDEAQHVLDHLERA